MFDIIVKNGILLDGKDFNERKADIGVKGGKIAAIGSGLFGARQVIDASNKMVTPGFIDMHSHSGLAVFDDGRLEPKIRQGITTELVGVDGIAAAPVTDQRLAERKKYLVPMDGRIEQEWSWRTFPEYLTALKSVPASTNFVSLIPHGAVRDVLFGSENRQFRLQEKKRMVELFEEGFREGAAGLSFGLIYYPGAFAGDEELRACAQLAAEYQKIIAVHVRNESWKIIESVKEMGDLALDTGARIHISHLKIIGKDNFHLVDDLLAVFDFYHQQGASLSFDQYPYLAGNTKMATLLPPWAHEEGSARLLQRLRDSVYRAELKRYMANGVTDWENLYKNCGWENIYISSVTNGRNLDILGLSVAEIADNTARDPFEIVFDLLVDEELDVGMIDFYGSKEVASALMQSPYHTLCTDGIFSPHPHPRLYGAYPRFIGQYVRERGVLTLKQAVTNITTKPAELLGLKDRGRIAEGMQADLVVFDYQRIRDTSTYPNPVSFPVGIDWVIVNGQLAVNPGGEVLGLNGQVLLST